MADRCKAFGSCFRECPSKGRCKDVRRCVSEASDMFTAFMSLKKAMRGGKR
jgi:hypothetical protein